MKKIVLVVLVVVFAGLVYLEPVRSKFAYLLKTKREVGMEKPQVKSDTISLLSPHKKGEFSLEETIAKRRSRRDFLDKPLSLGQLSQILWSAQGITDPEGFKRAAPSAGALYPLELYIVIGEKGVENIGAGVYHYLPQKHAIEIHISGDLRRDLAEAALGQYFLAEAPISLVIAADYERTTGKYGERGVRYVHIEVGHLGQNVYLQAEALGLGTVSVGAFNDEEVANILNLPPGHQPLYIMPLGFGS